MENYDLMEISVSIDPTQPKGNLGPVLEDVESLLPPGHQFRDSDPITWTHEGTHGVNARIRREKGSPGIVGIYIGGLRCCLLEVPPIKLSDVAKAVPRELRGDIYTLYLVQQQRWWENDPLYVLDEWSAYLQGADYRQAHEYRTKRGGTCQYMREMQLYSFAMWKAAGYPRNLRLFMMAFSVLSDQIYNANSLEDNGQDLHLRYWANAREAGWWEQFEQHTDPIWLDRYIRGMVTI